MYNKLKTMAEQLATNGKIIQFSHNSVFTAMKELNNGNEMAGRIAGQLGNEIGQIRNIFLPVVKEFSAAVNKKLNDTKQPSALTKYQVVERRLPSILTELQNKKFIVAKRKPIQIPTSSLIIPCPTEDVAKQATFKNTVLDTMLEEILATFDNKALSKLWERFLGNVSGTNDNISMLPYRTLENLNETIILMAIVYNLKGEKPAGVRISDSNYKSTMNDFYNEIANNIASAIDKFDVTTKINKLVLGTKDEFTIVVNAEVYDKFIETNTVETLLGLLLSGKANEVTNLDAISAEAGKYTNLWETAVKREQIRESQQQVRRFKTAYVLVIPSIVAELSEAAKKFSECDEKTIAKETEDLLNSFDFNSSISNIDFVSRHIIGKLVFTNTNLFRFLNYMDEYGKVNPKITSDEAATMASLDIIIDYLSLQFEIKE